MGLLDRLIKGIAEKTNEETDFIPNFEETEYNNWLNYLSAGGTTKEWNALKKANAWEFKKDDVEIFEDYQKKIKPISDEYYNMLNLIKEKWSVLYNSKNYDGTDSIEFEKLCIETIDLYKKMSSIDKKFGKKSPENVPAFKRLAMLYEKRKDYEKAVSVCVEALENNAWGDGMALRLEKMVKKANRPVNEYEKALIDTFNKQI